MKTAVILAGISSATFFLCSPGYAQYSAAEVSTTISAANTVNQSQQAPARDPRVAARYGNDVADRQARAQQQRQPQAQQLPPAFVPAQPAGRATQLANPAVTAQPTQAQTPAPGRDPRVAARYGNDVADRQARARQQPQPQAQQYGQPTAGQAAVATPVYVPKKREADPEREQRIIDFQRQKAISGNPTSQYDLGMRYLKGDGLEKDNEQAMTWLNMAAKGGNTRAKKQLDTLASKAKSAPASE